MQWLLSILALSLCLLVRGQEKISEKTKAMKCDKMDIIFALDGSTSLGEANFEKVKNFVKYTMMPALGAEQDHRAMVVQYSDEVKDETPFMKSLNNAIKSVSALPYRMGATYLKEALTHIRNDILPKTRPDAQVHVVIVSDGHSASEPDDVAKILKEQGVKIYGLLIEEAMVKQLGPKAAAEITRSLIQLHSTTERTGRLHLVSSFSDLSLGLAEEVYKELCYGMGEEEPEPKKSKPSGAAPLPLIPVSLDKPQPAMSAPVVIPDLPPVDCVVEYGEFASCSVSCGQGIHHRHATINVQPKFGGKPCPPLVEVKECDAGPCPPPIDCQFKLSEEWSQCSVTCGVGEEYQEVIIQKEPQHGGQDCPKPKLRTCQKPDCPPDFDCSFLDDGNYPFKSNCSIEFVTCSNGFPYLQKCPKGLYFNPKSQVCDTWYYIKECSGHERTTTTTTPMSTGDNLIEPITEPTLPEFDCTDKPDDIFRDPKVACSQHFYMCAHGKTTKHHCPHKLYFDSKRVRCDRWTKVFDCSGLEHKPTTTTMAPSTTTEEPHPIDCKDKANGDYHDPLKSCSKIYYTCDNHRSHRRVCPRDMYFDAEQGLCDSHNYVISCGGKPRTTTTALPTTTRSKGDPEFDCSLRQSGNYGAAPCVAHYFTCVGDFSIRRPCPSHLRYDAEIDKCELKQFVPSCGGTRTTTPSVTTTMATTAPLPIDCSRKKDGMHANPGGCSGTYYNCANGQTFEFYCPASLFFNPKKLRCERYVEACV